MPAPGRGAGRAGQALPEPRNPQEPGKGGGHLAGAAGSGEEAHLTVGNQLGNAADPGATTGVTAAKASRVVMGPFSYQLDGKTTGLTAAVLTTSNRCYEQGS